MAGRRALGRRLINADRWIEHPMKPFDAALLASAASATVAVAQPAPQNFAPNSQWEIVTGFGASVREKPDGSGTEAPYRLLANTVDCNLCTATVDGFTGSLKVDDLVRIDGPGVDPDLRRAPMRVYSVDPGKSFTFALPLGLKATLSRPATVTNVMIGGAASIGTGDGPDGWSKSTSLMVWREDARGDRPAGADYSLGVQRQTEAPEYVVTRPAIGRVHGRTLAFGAYVEQKSRHGPGTWRIVMSSNGAGGKTVLSPAAPAGPAQWRWLEASYAVPDDASEVSVGVQFEGAPGDIFYMANPVVAFASTIGADNYVKPMSEVVIPVVKLTPATWYDASIRFPTAVDKGGTHGFTFDAYAETGGGVAPTVARLDVALEGVDRNPVGVGPDGGRVIAFRSAQAPPTKYAAIMAQYATDVKSFAGPTITLDGSGRAFVYGAPGDSWYNVSMDINGYLLK
jgi:hypothetical protein